MDLRIIRAVVETVAEAAAVGAWTAARELSPGRRRLARAAVVAAM